jgi:succinate dehydrogenase/fumarate reductase flavoprotein subunit
LNRGIAELDAIAGSAENADVSPYEEGWADIGHLFDLRAALLTARATLIAAREREESRGAHHRADFPDTDTKWRVALEARLDVSGEPRLGTARPLDVPELFRPGLNVPAPELSGVRLLE